MITHVFKDGTTTTELKSVYVPSEIVDRIHSIVKEGNNNEETTDQKVLEA